MLAPIDTLEPIFRGGNRRRVARSAHANATALVDVGVLWREFVAAFAVCLFCSFCDRSSASHYDVDTLRDRFQVIRVYTGRISTQMVGDFAIRDRTDKQFVSYMVSYSILPIPGQVPVAVRQFGTSPEPTSTERWMNRTIFVNLGPKRDFRFFWREGPCATATCCVPVAQGRPDHNYRLAAIADALPQCFTVSTHAFVGCNRQPSKHTSSNVYRLFREVAHC